MHDAILDGEDETAESGTRAAEMLAGPRAPRSAAQASLLVDAGRVLLSSADYRATLPSAAALALPVLADWCVVDEVEVDGAVCRLAVVHLDVGLEETAARLRERWKPAEGDPIGAPAVLRSPDPAAVVQIDFSEAPAPTGDAENAGLLRALGLGRALVVPLRARDRVLGALTFVRGPDAEPFGREEIEIATDLAARGALAVDNARLLREAEQARLEADLANRARREFLATSSHEIRTPINAIIGYAQLLDMGLAGPVTERQRIQLERIHSSGQHLLGLVNEILDLARIESGQLTVRRERDELGGAAAAACDLMYAHLRESGLTLERAFAGSEAAYVGDPGRVRQVLVSLLANACKFTPAGGRVRVACGVASEAAAETRMAGEGPWAYVEVADTGRGVEPGMVARIFDPFVQGDGSHTRTRGGSGLGLPIARELARLMGGDLSVRSSVGEGSRFTLWLPAAADAEASESDRRHFDRDGGNLVTLGGLILDNVATIAGRFTRRLRRDPRVPLARDLGEVELRNNLPNLLSCIAQTLVLAHTRGGGASVVLRDGSQIQHTICELHGAQRRRIGWTEAGVSADFQALRAAVEAEARRLAPAGAGLDGALEVLERILAQAERTSLHAWRLAPPRDIG